MPANGKPAKRRRKDSGATWTKNHVRLQALDQRRQHIQAHPPDRDRHVQSYDGLGIVVWTIDFESPPQGAASVAELGRSAISDGIDGMERDLRGA